LDPAVRGVQNLRFDSTNPCSLGKTSRQLVWQKIATMKPIHVVAIILISAFGIVWCVQFWPTPMEQATDVSGSSWEDGLGKRVHDWIRAIKRSVHRSRHASPGVYFTLTYISVRNPSGITGVSAGTQVACVKDEGPVLLVKAANLEFEAKREYLTDDLDVADLALRNDAEAQQEVASYIARQQQAIDQRNDKRKMHPSGQH
jgi:hypothetical protein